MTKAELIERLSEVLNSPAVTDFDLLAVRQVIELPPKDGWRQYMGGPIYEYRIRTTLGGKLPPIEEAMLQDTRQSPVTTSAPTP